MFLQITYSPPKEQSGRISIFSPWCPSLNFIKEESSIVVVISNKCSKKVIIDYFRHKKHSIEQVLVFLFVGEASRSLFQHKPEDQTGSGSF